MKKIAAALSVAAITAGAALGPVSPASATVTDCPSGRACGWDNTDYTGWRAGFQSGSSDLRVPIGGHVYDNEFSSIVNFTGQTWCYYAGYNFTGAFVTVANNSGGSLVGTGLNNAVSSVRPSPAGGC